MSTKSRRVGFAMGVLALGVVLGLSVRPAGTVALIYHGSSSNRKIVNLQFTNATRRTISYSGTARSPELHWMTLTPQGWKRTEFVHTGALDFPIPRSLGPSEGIVFRVFPYDTPCKIQVSYSDGRHTNGIWRLLPRWLASRLPWLKQTHTLETPVF